MALQKTHSLAGVVHENLYIRFHHIILKEKVGATVNVRGVLFAHETKEKADEGSQPVCYFDVEFAYDLTSTKNIWEQAYDAAKSLDVLEGAIDV